MDLLNHSELDVNKGIFEYSLKNQEFYQVEARKLLQYLMRFLTRQDNGLKRVVMTRDPRFR